MLGKTKKQLIEIDYGGLFPTYQGFFVSLSVSFFPQALVHFWPISVFLSHIMDCLNLKPCDYQLRSLTTRPHSKKWDTRAMLSCIKVSWCWTSFSQVKHIYMAKSRQQKVFYPCHVPLFTLAPALEMCLFSSFHIPCSRSTAVILKAADGLWWRSS